ncbi:hypothetical protein BV898_09632 [Hypsibius exemplaris]|uniref:Reverse transcriptase zinc-binding domain-containing protein n=1 Tax=Hypsibius exemplaris TaxID=2072580 RepID=A0A1W0WM93_HYPEX|nr:hypothetical protein BV898_09632 [Hypsibius exemplaris]
MQQKKLSGIYSKICLAFVNELCSGAAGNSHNGEKQFLFQICPRSIVRAQFLDLLPRHLLIPLTRSLSSGHHLAVETGRWENVLVRRKDRKCLHCDNLEDEDHWFFECPCYSHCREDLHSFLLAKDLQTANLTDYCKDSLRNRSFSQWSDIDREILFVVAKLFKSVLRDCFSVYKDELCLFDVENVPYF